MKVKLTGKQVYVIYINGKRKEFQRDEEIEITKDEFEKLDKELFEVIEDEKAKKQ